MVAPEGMKTKYMEYWWNYLVVPEGMKHWWDNLVAPEGMKMKYRCRP
jgi:hypothetical protein